MQEIEFKATNGATQLSGVDPDVTLSIPAGGLRTSGRTLYVIPGGAAYDSIAVEGLLPGGVWVPAMSSVPDALVHGIFLVPAIQVSDITIFVLGVDYLALRVTATGGSNYVAAVPADPEATPPVEGSPEILASTLKAGLIA
jgi:hypothetical protein